MGFVHRENDKIVADLRKQVNTDICDSKLTLKHSGESYDVLVHGCVLSSVSAVVASAYAEWLHSPQRSDSKFLMALQLPQFSDKKLCIGAVHLLVAYLYGDAVKITGETAAIVLKLAQTFQVQDLTDVCLHVMNSSVSSSVSTNGPIPHAKNGGDQASPNGDIGCKSEASESSLCDSKDFLCQVTESLISVKNEKGSLCDDHKNNTFHSPAERDDTTLLPLSSRTCIVTINQSSGDENDRATVTSSAPQMFIQGKKSVRLTASKLQKKRKKQKSHYIRKTETYKGDTVIVTALPVSPDQKFQYSDGSGGIRVEIPQRRENGKRIFFCNMCDKVGNFKQSLQNHVIGEHTDVRVLCPHCNQQYINESYVSSHIRKYHSKHPYKQFLCELCGYKTIHSYQMTIHNRKYHGAGAFHCSQPGCYYKAYTKDRIQRHSKTHGPRKFLCPSCGSAFKSHRELERHLLIHDKPFMCQLCDFKNARGHRLRAHMLKHHPEHG